MLLVVSDVDESFNLRQIVGCLSRVYEVQIVNVGVSDTIKLKEIVTEAPVKWFFIYQKTFFFTLPSLKKAYFLIRNMQTNSILISGYKAQFPFILLGRLLGKKVIFIRHYTDTHHSLLKIHWWLLDVCMNIVCSKVIAVSSITKSLMISREFINANKVTVINNAVDIYKLIEIRATRQVSKRSKEESLNVLSIARHVKIKGLKYVLEALKHLESKGINFNYTLLGAKTRYSQKLEKQIAAFPEGRIKLITEFNHIDRFLLDNDVLVHVPIRSTAESFGLVYIEGLVSGIKCLFTQSGVLCDSQIIPEHFYWKIKYKSAHSIANALEAIYWESSSFREKSTDIYGEFSPEALRVKYLRFMRTNELN